MKREHFGGRMAVVLAMAGSAIGLGNIWRFPYMVGQNGGAAFIIVYILASLLLSMPIFFSESIIGRASQSNLFGAMKHLAPGTRWSMLGLITLISPFVILSYYSVVGGWSVQYLVKSCVTGFSGLEYEELSGLFGTFISSVWSPLLFHTVFILICAVIVSAGVKSGIEKFNKFSIPLLLVLIVAIMIYSISLPGASEGIRYMIRPDFSKITPSVIIAAMGQSFFSLSLGVGTILTYSSYMRRGEDIVKSGLGTMGFDLVFALIAGFAVMPAVFSAGIEPGAGPGLIYEALPYVFSKMGASAPLLSRAVSILFFLSIVIAALTSAISLFEIVVAYLVEEKKMTRLAATALILGASWLLGVFCSLSFGPLEGLLVFGKSIFDFCDYFASNILMAFGGLLFTVFVGWKMKKNLVRSQFTLGGRSRLNSAIFGAVYFSIKYIAPIAILIIFITNIFG